MRLTTCALFLAVLLMNSARNADAALLFTLQEVGADVVLTGRGRIDVTGLSSLDSGEGLAGLAPNEVFLVGSATTFTLYDLGVAYLAGPDKFGPGATFFSTLSASGDTFGLDFNVIFEWVMVPLGYKSGDPLSGSATLTGHTFASLGVTPGTYTWTIVPTGDTITLSTVPEPTSITLLGAGLLALVGYRLRRWATASRLT